MTRVTVKFLRQWYADINDEKVGYDEDVKMDMWEALSREFWGMKKLRKAYRNLLKEVFPQFDVPMSEDEFDRWYENEFPNSLAIFWEGKFMDEVLDGQRQV
jgi:hypothetical protein